MSVSSLLQVLVAEVFKEGHQKDLSSNLSTASIAFVLAQAQGENGDDILLELAREALAILSESLEATEGVSAGAFNVHEEGSDSEIIYGFDELDVLDSAPAAASFHASPSSEASDLYLALLWHVAGASLSALNKRYDTISGNPGVLATGREFLRLGVLALSKHPPTASDPLFAITTHFISSELVQLFLLSAFFAKDRQIEQTLIRALQGIFLGSSYRLGWLRTLKTALVAQTINRVWIDSLFEEAVKCVRSDLLGWDDRDRRILFASILPEFFEKRRFDADTRRSRATLLWHEGLSHLLSSKLEQTQMGDFDSLLVLHSMFEGGLLSAEDGFVGLDVRCFDLFWRVIQRALQSDMASTRKLAIALIQKCLNFCAEHSSTAATGSRLFQWPVDRETWSRILELWRAYLLVFDTLEESDLHLIEPVWASMPTIIDRGSELVGKHPMLDESWLTLLYVKGIAHKIPSIRKWIIVALLRSRIPFSVSFLTGPFLDMLDDQRLYRGQAAEPVRAGVLSLCSSLSNLTAQLFVDAAVASLFSHNVCFGKFELCFESFSVMSWNPDKAWARGIADKLLRLVRLKVLKLPSPIAQTQLICSVVLFLINVGIKNSACFVEAIGGVTFDPVVIELLSWLRKRGIFHVARADPARTSFVEFCARAFHHLSQEDTVYTSSAAFFSSLATRTRFARWVAQLAVAHFLLDCTDVGRRKMRERSVVGCALWSVAIEFSDFDSALIHTKYLLDTAIRPRLDGAGNRSAAGFGVLEPTAVQLEWLVRSSSFFPSVGSKLLLRSGFQALIHDVDMIGVAALFAQTSFLDAASNDPRLSYTCEERIQIWTRALCHVFRWAHSVEIERAHTDDRTLPPRTFAVLADICTKSAEKLGDLLRLCAQRGPSDSLRRSLAVIDICCAVSFCPMQSSLMLETLVRTQTSGTKETSETLGDSLLARSLKVESRKWEAISRALDSSQEDDFAGSLKILQTIMLEHIPAASRDRLMALLKVARACANSVAAAGLSRADESVPILSALMGVCQEAIESFPTPRHLLRLFSQVAFQPSVLALALVDPSKALEGVLRSCFWRLHELSRSISMVLGGVARTMSDSFVHEFPSKSDPSEQFHCVSRSISLLSHWEAEIVEILASGFTDNNLVRDSAQGETYPHCSFDHACGQRCGFADIEIPLDPSFARVWLLSAICRLASHAQQLGEECDRSMFLAVRSLCLKCLNTATKIDGPDMKYNWHTEEHRLRTRLWQAICVLISLLKPKNVFDLEELPERIWGAILGYNHKSVRPFIELAVTWSVLSRWRSPGASRAVLMGEVRDLLLPLMLNGHSVESLGKPYEPVRGSLVQLRADCVISACNVAMFIIQGITTRSDSKLISGESGELATHLLVALGRCGSETHAVSRGVALNALASVTKELQSCEAGGLILPEVLSARIRDPGIVSQCFFLWDNQERASGFMTNFVRHVDATVAPSPEVSLQIMQLDSDFPEEDAISAEIFALCFAPARTPVDARVKLSPNGDQPAERSEGVAFNAGALDTVFQKKIIPDMSPENDEWYDGISELRVSQELVIVASLVDRIPNLGGLTRTGEIFAIKELVVPNLQLVQQQGFREVAVSADRWLPFTPVPPSELKQYLEAKRAEGWCCIGVEQTNESKSLHDFKFPKRSVLVLGSESEGIPTDLLGSLDVCVEVPQLGVIRSLNVHVTGSLFMYEYSKQWAAKHE